MITLLNRENDIQDLEKNIKVEEYLNYLNEHVANVVKMYNELFRPFLSDPDLLIMNDYFNTDDFKRAILELSRTIETHDASKYEDEEFEPYRRLFLPTKAEEAEEDQVTPQEEFEAAWEHHYRNNSHHPKYWVNPETGIASDMNLRAIIEMICDWCAMSYKFGNDVIEWYETKADKEKKAMTERTKNITEYILYTLLNGRNV